MFWIICKHKHINGNMHLLLFMYMYIYDFNKISELWNQLGNNGICIHSSLHIYMRMYVYLPICIWMQIFICICPNSLLILSQVFFLMVIFYFIYVLSCTGRTCWDADRKKARRKISNEKFKTLIITFRR